MSLDLISDAQTTEEQFLRHIFVRDQMQEWSKEPLVMVTTATTGDGVPQLLDALDRHRARVAAAPDAAARLARTEAQVWSIVGERVRDRLTGDDSRASTDAILRQVAAHELDPFAAADLLLDERRSR